jgi:hypothetical protein
MIRGRNENKTFHPVFPLTVIGASPARAAQAPAKVTMTTGSFSERETAMFVAQDHGFFRRYGLDLTFVHVHSGFLTTPSRQLISGIPLRHRSKAAALPTLPIWRNCPSHSKARE